MLLHLFPHADIYRLLNFSDIFKPSFSRLFQEMDLQTGVFKQLRLLPLEVRYHRGIRSRHSSQELTDSEEGFSQSIVLLSDYFNEQQSWSC